ncbi:helix-turn-helix domain-containing protein [Pseudalkalibacillus salsuginis]|uniref:helix-turn-helix domain-containing protein n=1 Tax=Pseudalkalibacillus salsuginis TaxID=2910972 RepID=UPI001F173324|nr:AraC family transcriptional regulator [Pseudalkalibacillus salsuginis]MCF6409671.1 AraC family transcriptional regulator [Pseudalkalibacillus salsuginis]
MIVCTYSPKYPISEFVDFIWYMQGYNPAHSRELAFPDGSAEVVIDLLEDTTQLYDHKSRELVLNGSVVCGPHSNYFVIDTSSESKVLGIHFKPGGLRPFIPMPLHELLNTHVSLQMLWGARATELREELLELSTPEEMFPVLERRLLMLLSGNFESHPVVRYALNHIDRVRVGNLMQHIGMSHRRFIELFKAEVGMTPKRLSRIIRFQEVLQLTGNKEEINWTDIALQCGYYDQAHFIKDFQSFSGVSPSHYRMIPGRHYNHAVSPE